MITAEDFLQESLEISHFYNDKYNKMCCLSDDVQKAMIQFAKLHVESALQSASKNAKRKKVYNGHPQRLIVKRVIDKESILNAYPLTNIK